MSRSRKPVALLAAAAVAAGTLAAPLGASAAARPAVAPASPPVSSTDLASAVAKQFGVSRATAAEGLRAAGVDQRAAGGNADLGSLDGLLSFLTPLLALPGQGSLQTLLDALGLHQVNAAALAELPTLITVPGGLSQLLTGHR